MNVDGAVSFETVAFEARFESWVIGFLSAIVASRRVVEEELKAQRNVIGFFESLDC